MAEGLYVVLPSGYEYDFVSTVYEEYHCLICHLPVREPVLTRCGHRYCKNCLEEAMRRQQIPECPVDREVLDKEKDVFPDKATERKILSCHVKCPSVSCEWTGETRDAEKHLQGCCHKVIRCPNLHCHVTVERRLLDEHVANTCQWRAVQCTYCGERHPECEGQKHAAECRRLLIDCTNGCGDVIAREEMRTHQEQVCPLTVVNCGYEYLGCESKIKRRDVADHLEQSLRSHFELSIGRLNHVQDEHKKQQRELEQVKLDYHSVVSRLAGLEKDVTELKSRQKDMETFSPFIWKLPDFWERVRRAKSDRDIRVESEPFYVGHQGYKMKLAMYPNGAKEAKNAYISFYVAVMKGKYDPILPWPFRCRVILTIIDQNPDPMQRNNFVKSFLPEPTWTSMQRPTSDENERRGFGRFFSHEKLRTGSYIVDGALFIKFEVSPQENLELHVTRNDLSRREVKY